MSPSFGSSLLVLTTQGYSWFQYCATLWYVICGYAWMMLWRWLIKSLKWCYVKLLTKELICCNAGSKYSLSILSDSFASSLFRWCKATCASSAWELIPIVLPGASRNLRRLSSLAFLISSIFACCLAMASSCEYRTLNSNCCTYKDPFRLVNLYYSYRTCRLHLDIILGKISTSARSTSPRGCFFTRPIEVSATFLAPNFFPISLTRFYYMWRSARCDEVKAEKWKAETRNQPL